MFQAPPLADDEVLFYLPITRAWLRQVVLGLVLLCHSSFRGVIAFFRDLLDQPIALGTVHNIVQQAVVDNEIAVARDRALDLYNAGRKDEALASMGIYVFNTDFLFEQLIRDADEPGSTRDFGKDILPHVIDKYKVVAYPYRDAETDEQSYWRDVGTVDAYWTANMELIGVTPELNLYNGDWPIWTYQEQLPPAKFVFDDEDRRGMAVPDTLLFHVLIYVFFRIQSQKSSDFAVRAVVAWYKRNDP